MISSCQRFMENLRLIALDQEMIPFGDSLSEIEKILIKKERFPCEIVHMKADSGPQKCVLVFYSTD